MSNEQYPDEDDIDDLTDLGYTLIQHILDRAPQATLKLLVEAGAPLWYQNEDGLSPLHAAAHIEDPELIGYLIDNGAIWNAVDNLGNTAGDVCLSLNNEACYRIIRDTGIRTEYLLSVLSTPESESEPPSSTLRFRSNDSTAAGSSSKFLTSSLRFTTDAHGQEICLVEAGGDEVGVMMGWERNIMQETVNKMCLDHPNINDGLKVLNIGFGLGIIDSMFQSLPIPPAHHVIIEAHPDVLKHMRQKGWYEKRGVTILEGKWQDFIDSEQLLAVGGFDAVYTDTFSESYQDLHNFFGHLPDLLSGPHARFSFFNGLGATNALFYDVYTQLAELHLSKIGISVTWSDVDVVGDDADDGRWGDTRKYFGMRLYRLPIGRMST